MSMPPYSRAFPDFRAVLLSVVLLLALRPKHSASVPSLLPINTGINTVPVPEWAVSNNKYK
jgi:hypothetical protein